MIRVGIIAANKLDRYEALQRELAALGIGVEIFSPGASGDRVEGRFLRAWHFIRGAWRIGRSGCDVFASAGFFIPAIQLILIKIILRRPAILLLNNLPWK